MIGLARGVGPRNSTRILCYCDDCQQFARFLGLDGVLDSHGGTDLLAVVPARVRITGGAESLRAVRLSPKGLLRWYAGCCNTPIGNTLATPGAPFVGLIHSFMDHAGDGRPRAEVLGPPRGMIHGRFAQGGMPAGAHPKVPLGLMPLIAGRLLAGWVARQNRPSPFFDPVSGAPVTPPRVLTKAERAALR